MRVTYSQAAQRDRLRQIEYVEQFSYSAADRLDVAIEHCAGLLGRFPELGKQCCPNTVREFAIRQTGLIIRYRVEPDRVLILRILHSAQNWPGRF